MATVATLLTADFLGTAIKYESARHETKRVIQRLQTHKSKDASLEHVMIVFGDYNSAVEAMQPFPKGLYARHEKRLNEEYKMYLTGPQ